VILNDAALEAEVGYVKAYQGPPGDPAEQYYLGRATLNAPAAADAEAAAQAAAEANV
jgi:hypothetical protein